MQMTRPTTSRTRKNDEERRAITAAAARLLADPSTSTTGKLSVLELAKAAGVKRWVLTHKHVDLKEAFEAEAARVMQTAGGNSVPQRLPQNHGMSAQDKELLARLRRENAALHERVAFLAHVLNQLTIVYEALKAAREADSDIPRLHRERRPVAVDGVSVTGPGPIFAKSDTEC